MITYSSIAGFMEISLYTVSTIVTDFFYAHLPSYECEAYIPRLMNRPRLSLLVCFTSGNETVQ